MSKARDWLEMQPEVRAAKAVLEKEKALRQEVADLVAGNKKAGTHRKRVTDTLSLKVVTKRKFELKKIELFDLLRPQLEQVGVTPDTLLKVKYELEQKEAKKLTPEQWLVLKEVLELKTPLPTIEIEKNAN